MLNMLPKFELEPIRIYFETLRTVRPVSLEALPHLARVEARGLRAKPGQETVERLARYRGRFDLGPGIVLVAMSGEMRQVPRNR